MMNRNNVTLWVGLAIGTTLLLLLLSPRTKPGPQTAQTNSSALRSQGQMQRAGTAWKKARGLDQNGTIPAGDLWARMLSTNAGPFELPREKLDAFIARNHTNAASLMAAWQSGGGRDYLKKAAELYPNDPSVAAAVVALNLFPEEQKQWIQTLKKTDPNNSLANYLAAREGFRSGDKEAAYKELATAMDQKKFDDLTLGNLQEMETLNLENGKSPAEAKAIAGSSLLLPHLVAMKDLSGQIVEMQKQFLASGDTASANALASYGIAMGEQLANGPGGRTLIGQLVGIAIEDRIYKAFPRDALVGANGTTAQQAIDSLAAQRTQIRNRAPFFDQVIQTRDESLIISFFDRMKMQGESAALDWASARLSP